MPQMLPVKPTTRLRPHAIWAAGFALLASLAVVAPGALARMPRAPRGAVAHEAIIGGQLAPIGQLASVADIIDARGREAIQCTGTVVAPTLVLTAAHCAVNMRTGVALGASGYRVLTGTVSGSGAEGQVSAVAGVLVYEAFHRRVDNGDAALLVLSTPTMAPPIALATAADGSRASAGAVATVAGWGDARYQQRNLTDRLRSADTVLQAPRWCSRNAPPFFARSEICTIDPPAYATGACHGDSGGPLLAPVGAEGEFVVIGVTVHGYGRCSTRFPTVYTRAALISPWVQSWIDAYKTPPPPASAAPTTPGTVTTPVTVAP
jgi:trypsin